MRTGKLYIDSKDAYDRYGVYVVDDGYNQLVAFPPRKTVKSNDWQEEDGIEADLSEPVLNTREVEIKFAVSGLFSRYFKFFELISDGAYHNFNFVEIGRTYRLRLTQQPNLDAGKILGVYTLKFADDFPLTPESDFSDYVAPASTVATSQEYLIDDHPTTYWGVRLLQGSLAEVMKSAAVKQNLLRNIPSQAGVVYDPQNVTYKSKDVKLNCLLRAASLTEFWRSYDAFLYDLIRPEERTLYVSEIEEEFLFYYKSCQTKNFFPDDGKIWFEFTLTVTFTEQFRILQGDMVLASESNICIETEDGGYLIDMQPDSKYFPDE